MDDCLSRQAGLPSDDDVGEGADALADGLVALARLQELLEGHEAVPVQVHPLKRRAIQFTQYGLQDKTPFYYLFPIFL